MGYYNVSKTWFVTGTDTEVGKTHSSCALIQALANQTKQKIAGFKPIASGSSWVNGQLHNDDALALQQYSTVALDYQDVNVLSLEEATAPHIASEIENRAIDLSALQQGLSNIQNKADFVVVEGAGGWHVPLLPDFDFADWVIAQQLPVILVVGVKLGCINHALLTAKAILQSGLRLDGWIANEVVAASPRQSEYLMSLQKLLPAPCLGIIKHGDGIHQAAQRLNVDLLLKTANKNETTQP